MSSVRLVFRGSLARQAGSEPQALEVPDSLEEAIPVIRQAIEANIGRAVLYSVLLNGTSLALRGKPLKRLEDGDEFSVVPVILGG